MVEAGITPMQAITSATSNAAALLKLDDRGVLTSGWQGVVRSPNLGRSPYH
jgi:imidazolonepropionase-like amidohydrolase